MIKKERLTITVDKEEIQIFKEIIKKEGIRPSFVINMLIKDFNKLYQGGQDE